VATPINRVLKHLSRRAEANDPPRWSDAQVLHVVNAASPRMTGGVRFDVFGLDYGCYVDLLATQRAPIGLLEVAEVGRRITTSQSAELSSTSTSSRPRSLVPRRRSRATFHGVSGELHLPPTAARRRPSVINVRPGRGGAPRQTALLGDPTTGLEEFGKVTWWPAPGPGTMLGVITRDHDGNAVADGSPTGR